MDLDERKQKILNAIIANYLETGEPVGSRTISKYTDLNLSSATIRNEMADLEEMGYIIQPYTSAGRIPSDQGYRFYVDQMMIQRKEEEGERKALLAKVDKMENLLQQVARVLAMNTNYATMVTAPQYKDTKLKFIQLSQVDENQLLAVIVVEGNVVKNKLIDVEEPLANDEVLKLNILLNSFLQGLSLQEINLELMQTMRIQAGMHAPILEHIFTGITDAIAKARELEVYTSGTTNILKYPELGSLERASQLLGVLEEKKALVELIDEARQENGNDQNIQVYIGEEAPVQNMKDCSIVTATYELEEGVKGTIGIIGPKRMDYEKVVTTLKDLTGELDAIFKKKM
ncbi:MAG TPA: heat-inducible transcription repressor HrcA [Lachnospiraceae bacterium]|nr:heat-inducible transcription repressor HrcA [Lachnospiraceae bacterium]HIS62001.1 heat-inducible transcription repressor HrcA [Candidatus Scybalomonas excrementigallinarum]